MCLVVVMFMWPVFTHADTNVDAGVHPAVAVNVDSGGHAGTGVNTDTGSNSGTNSVKTLTNPLPGIESIGGLVKSGVQVFSYIAVLIAALMFVVVGFKYIMAQGKPEKMKEASQWLVNIVIGVAVVIGANIAITIVINTLGATHVVDPKVIQSARDAIK